jgi:formamidopyrimidine-DNA glycosylase
MPELPEVETVRLGLLPALEGRIFARVNAKRADLRIAFPENFARRLTGRRVLALSRRAKYLLAHLDNGQTLIVHLGMSGRLTIHGAHAAVKPGGFHHKTADDGSGEGKHDHVVFETDDGTRIVFTDHRRFGLMTIADTNALSSHALFAGLGPEPLDEAFTPAFLSAALKGKRTPIKSALLDQRVVAGLGNIYVCEALFRAHLSPRRLAATLATKKTKGAPGGAPTDHAKRLVGAIHAVLNQAIKAGGSSLRDHRQTSGELGYFQHSFQVYDREGKKCESPGCGGIVRRFTQNGRSTFWCPKCQR